MVDSAYFMKSTALRVFTGFFQHYPDIIDIMKMCMKKFDIEKIFFDKLTGLLT